MGFKTPLKALKRDFPPILLLVVSQMGIFLFLTVMSLLPKD
jgi:hypothetical protein